MENQPSFIDPARSVLQRLYAAEWDDRGMQVFAKRDDLLHPEVSGNKWRKLKYNIAQAIHTRSEGIFTFGGAYSNHLLATASAAHMSGLRSVGFVRGDELTPDSNETLRRCAELGMRLEFLSREMYALHSDKQFVDELRLENPMFYAVPEGGCNYYGMVGCQEIWRELPQDTDYLFVAQGTGATSCGLLLGNTARTHVHVVPVLKGFDAVAAMQRHLQGFLFDEELAKELVAQAMIHSEYHFGGYARYTPELLQFIRDTWKKHRLPLDPVYTGKAFYALTETLKEPAFDGKKIVFLHTGGLQGCRAIEEKEGMILHP